MANNGKDVFRPAIAVPPGMTIAENIAFLGLDQEELAKRLGISEKHLSRIINGKAPITYTTALGLETVIGPSAQFWMNLESNYQLQQARLKAEKTKEAELAILKGIPYKEMAALKWVPSVKDKTEQIMKSRSFYGVVDLTRIQASYDTMFRKQKNKGPINNLAVLAWLRQAEKVGINARVEPLNTRKLKKIIPDLRQLTLLRTTQALPLLKSLLDRCGIALAVVPYLSKTYVCGATIWRKKTPIIAVSTIGNRADRFWFTTFHELAHLLLHPRNKLNIHYESDQESEADALAANLLIPNELYKDFVTERPFRAKEEIIRFAKTIPVSPSIVLGRLQHDSLIDYSTHTELIEPLELP